MSESTTSSKPEPCAACGTRLSTTRLFAYTPLGALRGVYCSGTCADREAETSKHSKLSEVTERFVDQLTDRERALLAERFKSTPADTQAVIAKAREKLALRSKSPWISVADQHPPHAAWVLVRGDSHSRAFPVFIQVARYDLAYEDSWRSIANDGLRDEGYVPTHWREITDEDRA